MTANRAAEICKFDLVTNMVYEFPELQGFMGERYALQKGENEAVATAINEHYMPRNAEDQIPSTDIGAVLSVAEKVDTIASFFAIGYNSKRFTRSICIKTSSNRCCSNLLQKNWQMALEEIVESIIGYLEADGVLKKRREDITKK